jgi:putative two-component system response regulator
VTESTDVTASLRLPAADDSPVPRPGQGTEYILIVDDDQAVRELIVSQVSYMGHRCTGARSGTEALAIAQQQPRPAVVLSDLEMPEVSGIKLLQQLLELDSNIQVVMVTAHDDLDSVRRCLRAGAYDYLVKPYDLEDLGQAIDRALERRRLTMELNEYQRDLERKVAEKTRQVLETRDIALLAVAKLAECRDDTTGFHLDRMQWFSRLLAEALADGPYAGEASVQFGEQLFKSSPLHDIGKVAIPDQILMKTGPLTEREWEIMKTHTTRGGDTLREVIEQHRSPAGEGARFLRMAMEIAYDHHERWDGRGYPRHKAGEEIPLGARIVALSDAYDAITSERPYKRALSHAEAVRRILDDRGRHFDPVIVDAFIRCAPKFEIIRRQMEGRTEETRRQYADTLFH